MTDLDVKALQNLLPEFDMKTLGRMINHAALLPALEDLELVIAQLKEIDLEAADRREWEATKDELLAETRRLGRRLCGEP